jgi:transcriptional regulator with XRE-family HTH domain
MENSIIKDKRIKLRLSQEQLANDCNTYQVTISYIENGTRVGSVKVLKAIAKRLKLKLTDII